MRPTFSPLFTPKSMMALSSRIWGISAGLMSPLLAMSSMTDIGVSPTAARVRKTEQASLRVPTG